ncbi:hypothetical protein J2T60_002075 [Natronospira proteinivora]|uniref:LysM domain-containing protein n=1 Tax=Natronospira proteinivora TaxID=1807133 RepID=A0ABT1G9R7_9GAMM|nr:LysM peptidoglycan-binding domain-containing protein [Natronospira proteinivora]MCP1728075.1 hypothetical protein [Natronospira proteinivora]
MAKAVHHGPAAANPVNSSIHAARGLSDPLPATAPRILIRGLAWASIAVLALTTACGGTPEPAPEEAEETVEEAPPEETFVSDPAPVEPAETAPREYIVQRGDTLWDISEMFLQDPWLWPEIWHINRQIRDPHLIYPGDVITLFYRDGRPHLQIERDGEIYQTTLPIERLSPQVRVEGLPRAIPFIPIDTIRPLLRRPQLMTREMIDDAPYLLRSEDGRLMTSAGDRIYVRNLNDTDARRFTIMRPGQDYRDPETGRLLGQEAIYVGQAELQRGGDPATFFVTQANREALEGDRLFSVEDRVLERDFYPRAPDDEIDGQVITSIEEGELIGQYQTVVFNRGSDHGLAMGHVLEILERGERVRDREQGRFSRQVRLPDETIGLALIYRVEEEVSFALVMRAEKEISEGDMIRNPRQRIRTPQTRERRFN